MSGHPFDVGDALPTLRGPRVILRWLTDADVPALHRIFSDPEVTRYWGFPRLEDRAAAERLLADIRSMFAARTLFQWGLTRCDDDVVIGTCTLAQLDATHRRAEIGFALGRDAWGQGWMKEALPLLLEFGFETCGLHRLEADVDPRNTASLGLVTALGFKQEGYLRERYLMHGEKQDAVFFGLLRDEWRR